MKKLTIPKKPVNTLKLSSLLLLSILATSFATAEEKSTKVVTPTMLTSGVISVYVKHQGETVQIIRNQNKKNEIVSFYRKTARGTIQPMNPFKPHAVETLGEPELISYLEKKSLGDDSILVIDSRTPEWVRRSGMIPGAVNIPFTKFREASDTVEIMEDQFDVITGETLIFSNAKTLVMYCNGNWCGQSPTAIKKLLAMGYPAAKIKYYRGGMQSWTALGLTVIK